MLDWVLKEGYFQEDKTKLTRIKQKLIFHMGPTNVEISKKKREQKEVNPFLFLQCAMYQ